MAADPRARLEEIYEAWSGLILAYAARRTSDAHDAADIVAETFAIAWRRIHDVPPGDEARPWLYAVAARVLANHHRGVRRRRRLGEKVATQVPVMVADATQLAEGPDGDRIAAALGRLAEADRELLRLVAWDGLGRDEIAAVLGCSAAVVRVRLYRARRRLAGHLAAVGVIRRDPAGHEAGRWAAARPEPEEAQ